MLWYTLRTISVIILTGFIYNIFAYYNTLSIPVLILNDNSTGVIYGVHEHIANNYHDLYIRIIMVNNARIITTSTMVINLITHIGTFSKMIHVYPHSSIIWWADQMYMLWWRIWKSHDYITVKQLLIPNIKVVDILEQVTSQAYPIHVDLYHGSSTTMYIDMLSSIGNLQLHNTNWPDIVQIDIILVPTCYTAFYYIQQYMICVIYILIIIYVFKSILKIIKSILFLYRYCRNMCCVYFIYCVGNRTIIH